MRIPTVALLAALTSACRPPPAAPVASPAPIVPVMAVAASRDLPPARPRCPLVPTHTEPRGQVGIYERHGDPTTDHEVWRHRVGGPRFSDSDLLALADTGRRDRLIKVAGVNGNGYALCCGVDPSADYVCLMVTAESSELDREHLARELAAMFARADHLDYDVIVFNEGIAR